MTSTMNPSAPQPAASADPGVAALRFAAVFKTFPGPDGNVDALQDVDLSVAQGEFVAVMGPSGCGKSTLLHAAGGLEPVTAGSIFVDGRDIGTLSAAEQAQMRRCDVGFVFQRLNLIASLTAAENIAVPLEMEGVSRPAARSAAIQALESVGLDKHHDRYPSQLSGGQQQRVAIARGVIGERSLILADEPTGALDTATGDQVITMLAELPKKHGTAVVLVTHEPRLASFADRVIFMRDGRIISETEAAQ